MQSSSEHRAGEHYDVVIVGAGLSGIGTAWRLNQRRPSTSYLIVEARAHLGGTWDLFRYPGVRSDSDISTFAFPFKPWPGEQAVATGEQIRDYLEDTATLAGITRRVRFNTHVSEVRWSSATQRWTVEMDGPSGPQRVTGGFVHVAAGYYDYAQGYQPRFEGREDFRGVFVHPQAWPQALDVAERRVVVIGSGSTAVTMVPALARTAATVTLLQRSPTWVASRPSRDPWADRFGRWLPRHLARRATRATNIVLNQATYALARRRPQRFAAMLRSTLRSDLPEDYLDAHFTPDYPPWDQRVCRIPDGDLTRAIAEGRAEMVTASIHSLVAEGVRLHDGRVLPADVVVSATGLSLLPLGGIRLVVDGEQVDPASRVAYRGLMLEQVPNLTFTVGYVNTSWTLRADLVARYLCRLLGRMERRGYAVARPGTAPDGPRRPLIGLKSGYVKRAAGRLPMLSGRRPWTFVQNYLLEAPELLYGPLAPQMTWTRVSTHHGQGQARG